MKPKHRSGLLILPATLNETSVKWSKAVFYKDVLDFLGNCFPSRMCCNSPALASIAITDEELMKKTEVQACCTAMEIKKRLKNLVGLFLFLCVCDGFFKISFLPINIKELQSLTWSSGVETYQTRVRIRKNKTLQTDQAVSMAAAGLSDVTTVVMWCPFRYPQLVLGVLEVFGTSVLGKCGLTSL